MKKKKILGILPNLESGGAERQMLIILEQLSKRGYDTSLVTYIDHEDCYSVPDGVKRVRIHETNKLMERVSLAKFLWCFDKNAIIITFLDLNIRDTILPLFFSKRKIIVGERDLKYKMNKSLKFLYFLERKAKAIIPNSFSQQEWMKTNTPWLSNKIATITNYTDTKLFYPNHDFINREAIQIIGVFGRFSEQKNYMRFAKAIKKVVEAGYKDFKVLWYGDRYATRGGGFMPSYQEFNNFVKENNINEYVEVRDFTKEVNKANNYCDVLCLPSLSEGFSNSLAEYICCGKPVLVSDVSDNHLMVKDGVNGFLFNPLNVDDMANTIINYLNLSESEREQMGKESRKLALELFDLDKFTQSYVNIIESL